MTNKLNNKKGRVPLETKTRTGFTIIEVVLVLAIAGLIFLIVFLALPGLQRSRRDTQRKSTLGNMAAALENYASNNGGKYPCLGTGTGCIDASGKGIATLLAGFTPETDPSGNAYEVGGTSGDSITLADGTTTAKSGKNSIITYVQGGVCSNGVASANGTNQYKYAISMVLESGNYCKDGGQTQS